MAAAGFGGSSSESGPSEHDEDSGGVLLLRHCCEIFEKTGKQWLTPTDLVHHLRADAEWPWATWRCGTDPITPRGVAKILGSLRDQVIQERCAHLRKATFAEAWTHYL